MSTFTVLSLFDRHVRFSTRLQLDRISTGDGAKINGFEIGAVGGAIFVEWGALEEERPSDVPADLWSVVSSADIRGCRAILLDPEADVVEGLELFDDEPGEVEEVVGAAGLVAAMDRLGLTVNEFAAITDTHPTTISRWRSGALTLPRLVGLLLALLVERGRVPRAWLKRGSLLVAFAAVMIHAAPVDAGEAEFEAIGSMFEYADECGIGLPTKFVRDYEAALRSVPAAKAEEMKTRFAVESALAMTRATPEKREATCTKLRAIIQRTWGN